MLTDLQIQRASNQQDNNPMSTQYKGPVLNCRFKVDSGAYGNLLPYNIYCTLYPGIPMNMTRKSIDYSVCLVAYNKEEIKQYSCCMLKVYYRNKTMVLPFYIVNSKFIGLDASSKLGMLTISCPIHQSWTSQSPLTALSMLSHLKLAVKFL